MHMPPIDSTTPWRPVLTSRDILANEQFLRTLLARFVPFKSSRLHFPPQGAEFSAEWLADEHRMIIPLRGDEKEGLLALLFARQVPARAARKILPVIEEIAALCVEQLRLRKTASTDRATGLAVRDRIIAAINAEIEAVRNSAMIEGGMRGENAHQDAANEAQPHQPGYSDLVHAEPKWPDPEWPDIGAALTHSSAHRAGFGLIVLRFSGLREVARNHGYEFSDKLLARLGENLLEETADRAIAGRTGDFEFTVLTPSASAAECRSLAEAISVRMAGISQRCSVTGELVGVRFGCGLVMFPADADPSPAAPGLKEQAQRLLRRARKAAAVATEPCNRRKGVMPFSRILADGGHVLDVLPLSRLHTSLGSSVRAAEGQRFAVFGPGGTGAAVYKGDIVLTAVRESMSEAEILHLDDPASPIRPGDRLSLLTEMSQGFTWDLSANGEGSAGKDKKSGKAAKTSGKASDKSSGKAKKDGQPPAPASVPASALDPASGFLGHRDFLNRFLLDSRNEASFCLALLRIQLPERTAGKATPQESADKAIKKVADRCRFLFASLPGGLADTDLAGGRYGLNSLIFFHAAQDATELAGHYEDLVRMLRSRDKIEAGVGIAAYPFLEFRKADTLGNSVHALEYAQLLPFPHVGVLDSLGLTVHADSLLNQGDTFSAITTYKQALLADAANQTARNSLAVCLASLGRYAEAEGYFLDVLAAQPKNAAACYNLGTVYQAMGDMPRARAQFKTCLRHAPGHIFACLRLGQIAEAENSLPRARHWYGRAEKLPGGHAPTRRHFAALALKQGKNEEARSLLYEALTHNPMDSAALRMLANLYMEDGEAPSLAEALARQSVALRPENRQNWLTLAAALDAAGKPQESNAARARANRRRALKAEQTE